VLASPCMQADTAVLYYVYIVLFEVCSSHFATIHLCGSVILYSVIDIGKHVYIEEAQSVCSASVAQRQMCLSLNAYSYSHTRIREYT
jgi:hypothetical protein